ncbi:FecR family protein [Seonamhaeicola maritimus]|uniref:FecR family protein n=1 Tax=Seonamhaeicola maritimus TaxID=2591822 RepID=UPI002494CB41|nr:FecR family protein [Seonamhaeicola maritimus]
MTTKKILSYINGSASDMEAKEVQEWINASQKNREKFNLLKAESIVSTFDDTLSAVDTEIGFLRYKRYIKSTSSNLSFLKYAAILVIALGTGYMYYITGVNQEQDIVIPKDAIILKLENGDTKIIEEGVSAQFADSKGNTLGEQKGNTLKYNKDLETEKLVYNTLTVPYGKRFDVLLSDNTRVTLNAGTSLRYPIKFLKGYNREVFINGEAFFDVSEDKDHPFVVSAKDINVRVLGTKFNVSSYPEEINTKTVLVEGSVSLYQDEAYKPLEATLLTPGHLATLNKLDNSISIEKVDVSLFTSWINGTVRFKHEAFKNILKKLERQYDVVINCDNNKLKETFFTASFDNASIEYILHTFKNNYDIEYTITTTTNRTTIIIN